MDAHNKQKEIDEAKNGLKAPFDSQEQAEYEASLLPYWAVAGKQEVERRQAQANIEPAEGACLELVEGARPQPAISPSPSKWPSARRRSPKQVQRELKK